ncbi:MAG: type II toxin-antitoxin system antitoxin DNA ADP-ribosyl glycohydrolase DarG [Bacillota bacterium]
MLTFLTGNLFDKSKEIDAIVNTVNCVGVMGKGIALEFKKRYPENFNIYKNECKEKNLVPGKMLTVNNTSNFENPKYIINFPTKNHWRNPSKIEYIESGLLTLKEVIKEHSIKSIAMPALGCGNGGLNWGEVKSLIIKELSSLKDVQIYIYEPNHSKNKNIKNLRITKQRALLLLLMDYYNSSTYNQTVSFIEVNYLAFILQSVGVDFKLDFKETEKGPFDPTLNKLLIHLANHDYLIIETKDNTPSLIKINKKKFRQKNSIIQKSDNDYSTIYQSVIELIKGFETPERLKILTLSLWKFKNGVKTEDLFTEVIFWAKNYKQELPNTLVRDAVNRVSTYYTEKEIQNLEFDI